MHTNGPKCLKMGFQHRKLRPKAKLGGGGNFAYKEEGLKRPRRGQALGEERHMCNVIHICMYVRTSVCMQGVTYVCIYVCMHV